VTTKLAEMWAALEAHKPAPEYAEAWQRMCRERTYDAARAAHYAAPAGSAAWWAAAAWATATAASANYYAQRAIDAMLAAREVKP
jgi:hypothetical protein